MSHKIKGSEEEDHGSYIGYLLIFTNAILFTVYSTMIKIAHVHPLLLVLSQFIFTLAFSFLQVSVKKAGWGSSGNSANIQNLICLEELNSRYINLEASLFKLKPRTQKCEKI